MTKKEYINKLENLIINRIKYHSPNLIDNVIDFSLLEALGIDAIYPIFVFKKPLNKLFYKAFVQAKKKAEFNLILLERPLISQNKIEKMERTFLFPKEEISSSLFYALDALNINYVTHSNFEKNLEGEYLKINHEKIDFEYIPYYNYKKYMKEGVIFEIKNYILNGKNFMINLINTKSQVSKVILEINLPLPRGYYFFKKEENAIEIENLTSREKAYFNFNFNFKNAKVSYSTMSGIESCTYACINVKVQIDLLPKQSKKIYYNFGEKKYCLFTPKEIQYYFELSQKKMNEIFDIKVTSHDKKFDDMFNFSLPRNIWEKWQNFDIDEKSENEWLKIKNNLLTNSEKGVQINQNFKGLKEIKFYRNNGWKRVFIVHNNACYMYADKVKYFNFTLLTNEIFNKNNEIYLSFVQ